MTEQPWVEEPPQATRLETHPARTKGFEPPAGRGATPQATRLETHAAGTKGFETPADARSSTHGKVTLVGAGPGDAGLLTIRGLRTLEEADVIVADRLGARGVLDGLAAEGVGIGAEVVDVGKLPGHHVLPQAAINELLVTLARAGKQVVRL